MKKITQQHIVEASNLLDNLEKGKNEKLTLKQINLVKALGYDIKDIYGSWNGYGYERLGKKIKISNEQELKDIVNNLKKFIKSNEKTATKAPTKKTQKEKIEKWVKRLSKLTGISIEEAEIIAEEKLNFNQEKIEELEERQHEQFSISRQKLINRLLRQNPLRRIVDKEHANAILIASKRHNETDYDEKLVEGRELAKMGEIDRSEVKQFARQNMSRFYNGGNLSPSRIEHQAQQVAHQPIPKDLKTKSISEIAYIISNDWKNVYFGASPYLSAMYSLNSINDRYGMDDGRTVVAYFLANASEWKGPVAKEVKAELNRRLKSSSRQMEKGGRVTPDKFINSKFGAWILGAKKSKKNIAIDYYDDDQLSAWTISKDGKLMTERTFDYTNVTDVMHDIDEARKLVFVDQAFRCGGQMKKLADGGQLSSSVTWSDEIMAKAQELSSYQFSKWLKDNFPKVNEGLNNAGILSADMKRFYFLKMKMVNPELMEQVEHGDIVTIIKSPHGTLIKGKAVMRNKKHDAIWWILNAGGQHGTPMLADKTNIVAIHKNSKEKGGMLRHEEHLLPPSGQMADGGQLTSLRSIIESIPNRKGINEQAVEFARQILEDNQIDEISVEDPDVQLLIQKLEKYPMTEIYPEPMDAPLSEPLPQANLQMLQTRLKIIKKMIAKKPEDKTLILRAKIVSKMIAKLKE